MATYTELEKLYRQQIADIRQQQKEYIPKNLAQLKERFLPNIIKTQEQIKYYSAQDPAAGYGDVIESLRSQEESWQRRYEEAEARLLDRYQEFDTRTTKRLESIYGQLSSDKFRKNLRLEKLEAATQEKKAEAAKVAAEREAAAAKFKQQQEASVREEAERKAGRARARTGGSRAAARPMLSAARMSPEQTMAPEQTLGTFMPK